MKLSIILSVLSLSLLAIQSLSATAPVDVLCNFIDSQTENPKITKGKIIPKGFCIEVFDTYPTIRQATYQGVALIANNITKKRLKNAITVMKRYGSDPSTSQDHKHGVEACLVRLRDINESLEKAIDYIMKRDYIGAVQMERNLMKNINSRFICGFINNDKNNPAPYDVQKSFTEFVIADVVAFKTILLLRKA